MKNNIWKLFSVGVVATLLVSCGSDLEKTDYDIAFNSGLLPALQTGEIITNAGNTAVTSITVNNQSNLNVLEQGIVYGTDNNLNLTSSNIVRATLEQDGTAKVIMEKMTPGTTYYYRSYAYTNEGIAYGEIKQFIASSKVWKRVTDYAVDFDSENCIDDFTPVKIAGKGRPWQVVPMSIQGLPSYMIVSSAIDIPSLFAGSLASTGDADNILQYEADFTGKALPAIGFYALDIDGFMVGWDRNSTIDVLVSPTPITTSATADVAEKIGSVSFSAKEFQADASFLLPAKYSNAKCYIALRNKATVANSFGVFLGDFYLTSLVEPK